MVINRKNETTTIASAIEVTLVLVRIKGKNNAQKSIMILFKKNGRLGIAAMIIHIPIITAFVTANQKGI
jgi:hypothetical protein